MIAGERSPEQRVRDGRLAWIIVGCCAVLTCVLAIVLGIALIKPAMRLAEAGVQADRQQRPAPLTRPDDDRSASVAVAAPTIDGQVQKRSAPAPQEAPPLRDGRELRKQGQTADNEVRKGQGGGDAPEASARRRAPDDGDQPENAPITPARRI